MFCLSLSLSVFERNQQLDQGARGGGGRRERWPPPQGLWPAQVYYGFAVVLAAAAQDDVHTDRGTVRSGGKAYVEDFIHTIQVCGAKYVYTLRYEKFHRSR